jgi:hypothetical protein
MSDGDWIWPGNPFGSTGSMSCSNSVCFSRYSTSNTDAWKRPYHRGGGLRGPGGYVEAVATRPEFQGRGLATAIMGAVAAFIQAHFELGALSGDPDFYERVGWVRWRGATWCREGESLTRTADEEGDVLVLPTRAGPPLDVQGDIAVEWRSGDVW